MSDHNCTVYYFIKHTLHLFLASLMLVSLSLIVSRLLPPTPQFKTLEMLNLLDCQLPCWIGIVPGKTTIGEATRFLEKAYPTKAYEMTSIQNVYDGTDWLSIRNRQDDNDFSVSFNVWQNPKNKTESAVISQITLRGAELALGEWYYALGRPQALSVTWGNHYALPNLLYNRQQVRLTINNRLNDFAVDNPSVSAGTLDIYDQLEWDKTYRPSYRVMWHGFSAFNKDNLLVMMQP
ncbi:MAG: hypothetical protein K8I30_16930 [Anaerolineae bacterium]|nr:hypothetical protein [Anaerolineae bacterium]